MYLTTKKRTRTILAAALSVSLLLGTPIVSLANTTQEGSTNPIKRVAGIDRYETAAKIAQEGWKDQSEYAILSAGMDENLVDALTAAPLAKAKNAPILLSQGNELNPYAKEELIRLGVKKVYITSGFGTIKESVHQTLKNMGIEVIPLGGQDRFETALNTAKALQSNQEIVITTAWSNADALSVASIAAAEGMPILLTDPQELPVKVAAYLKEYQQEIQQTYVIGGEGAVSEKVKNTLQNPVRMGGVDRYATNLEVFKTLADRLKYNQVFIANGENDHLVDALASSPLAAKSASPIFLAGDRLTQEAENYLAQNFIPNLTVLGGEGVVSATPLQELSKGLSYTSNRSTEGGTSPQNSRSINERIIIKGSEITLQNANIESSIVVQGDKAKLANLNVKGTIFLDPGALGSATLDQVTAKSIVVLSGGTESIYLNGVKADTLRVQSESDVRVVASQGSDIANTTLRSGVILESQDNALQNVKVLPDPAESKVTLKGSFGQVVVAKEAELTLGSNTTLKTLTIQANSKIDVDKTAAVSALVQGGYKLDLSGEGAASLKNSTVPVVPGGGAGGPIGGVQPKKIALQDILKSMELSINDTKTIPFSIAENESSVSLGNAGLADDDVIVNIWVEVYQDAELVIKPSFLMKLLSGIEEDEIRTSLESGKMNEVELTDLALPDNPPKGARYSKLKEFLSFGASINGVLVDQATGAEAAITITIND